MSEAITDTYGWDEAPPHSCDYINPAIRRIVKRLAPRDVLDVGCGNGVLCGELAADGVTITGIDGDAGGIALARRKHPGVRFEVARFESDPVSLRLTADGRFDCLVSTEVVEHLYAPHIFARFCYEALRPGGTLVISTPYHGYLKNLALSLANKWDHHHTPLWHGGHVKFWSRKTLSELLTKAGFEMTGFEGVGRAPLLWKSMILLAKKPA